MYICPVCGYDNLDEIPYDKDGNPSYEICPCCGFEFGFDDNGEISLKNYRRKWIERGALWFNEKIKPKNWDIKQQFKNIDIKI